MFRRASYWQWGTSRRSGRRAFTLLEVMCASAIAVVGIVGLISSLTTSLLASRSSYEMTQAFNSARRVMEETIDNDFDNLLVLNGSSIAIPDTKHTAVISVDEVGVDLRRIEVRIDGIPARGGDSQELCRFVTMRSRKD